MVIYISRKRNNTTTPLSERTTKSASPSYRGRYTIKRYRQIVDVIFCLVLEVDHYIEGRGGILCARIIS